MTFPVRSNLLFVAVLLVVGLRAPAEAQIVLGPRDVIVANVVSVESSTALVLDTGQRVKLLGLGWLGPSRSSRYAAAFDAASTKFTEGLVKGKRVWLQFDRQKYDLDGNMLAYVYLLKDGQFVNAEVLRQGYAMAFGGQYRNATVFARLHRQAAQSGAGLWARFPRSTHAAPRTSQSGAQAAGKTPPAEPVEVAELTMVELRPTKPFVATSRASALNNTRPGDVPVVAMPLDTGAQLFIGGGPNNVSRMTKGVKNKVTADTKPRNP